MAMKICAVIPSFNEERHIAEVVSGLKKHGIEALVIDDGSGDETFSLAKKAGAQLIKHGENMGKGYSVREGFSYCLKNGFDAAVTLDGDGQHRPEEIPKFVKAYESTKADIIIGNRMSDTKNMPPVRKLTNHLMSRIISRICGQYIPDTQCGYRFFTKKILESVKLESENYDAETEILIKASLMGFRIESVAVETIYSNQTSQINPVLDTIRFIKLLIKLKKSGI
jgi:glycosyltransferase involved in cell wall biosynthesis